MRQFSEGERMKAVKGIHGLPWKVMGLLKRFLSFFSISVSFFNVLFSEARDEHFRGQCVERAKKSCMHVA